MNLLGTFFGVARKVPVCQCLSLDNLFYCSPRSTIGARSSYTQARVWRRYFFILTPDNPLPLRRLITASFPRRSHFPFFPFRGYMRSQLTFFRLDGIVDMSDQLTGTILNFKKMFPSFEPPRKLLIPFHLSNNNPFWLREISSYENAQCFGRIKSVSKFLAVFFPLGRCRTTYCLYPPRPGGVAHRSTFSTREDRVR